MSICVAGDNCQESATIWRQVNNILSLFTLVTFSTMGNDDKNNNDNNTTTTTTTNININNNTIIIMIIIRLIRIIITKNKAVENK